MGAGLVGTADLAIFPATNATNNDPISFALRAGVGVSFAPRGGPLLIQLGYRLFRIDHSTVTGPPRLEQDETILLGIGIRR